MRIRRVDEEIKQQSTQTQENAGVWIFFGLLTSILSGIIVAAVIEKEKAKPPF
jgi:hypothetical protein